MTQHRHLAATAPWVELVATIEDWDAADPALLTTMLNQLVLIRTFEEYVLELQHRAGGRSGWLHPVAHERRLRQRFAPRSPPVPGQGSLARRTQGP
jgi:2-oxoisovalerate dehydrogenase E1 component